METEEKENGASRDGDAALPNGGSSFTSVQRILELTKVDHDVAQILRSAAGAVYALTGSLHEANSSDSNARSMTPKSASDDFESHTTEFYERIQAVSALFRRQIYALEEADIISAQPQSADHKLEAALPQTVATARVGPILGQHRAEPPVPITNGGVGNFDVGWLNSRRDNVERIKGAELLAEARRHVERLQYDTNGKGHPWSDIDVDGHDG